MGELAANGLRFHVQQMRGRSGADHKRPAVVMIHGLTVDLSSFYLTLACTVAAESEVYLYDLRGHGRSEMPPDHYLVSDHVADLAGLIDAWGIDRPVHLVANSYGGLIALFFAHQRPEMVASMFLIEPHLSGEAWGQIMVDYIYEFANNPVAMARLESDTNTIRYIERSRVMFETTTILDDLVRDAPVPTEWLEQMHCPVLTVYGSESEIVDRSIERDRHIPGCQWEVMPGGTHMLLAEEHLALRARLAEWVKQQRCAQAVLRG